MEDFPGRDAATFAPEMDTDVTSVCHAVADAYLWLLKVQYIIFICNLCLYSGHWIANKMFTCKYVYLIIIRIRFIHVTSKLTLHVVFNSGSL